MEKSEEQKKISLINDIIAMGVYFKVANRGDCLLKSEYSGKKK
jgi:hypothetical protein